MLNNQFWNYATERAIVLNACKVSLLVGTILNLINQGQQLYAGADIVWYQIAMNYLVPYCVSTYSAVKIAQQRHKG